MNRLTRRIATGRGHRGSSWTDCWSAASCEPAARRPHYRSRRRRLVALFGPRRPGLKLGVMQPCRSVTLAKGEHRVTAKSVLEGEVQRAAVAPFDGFIRLAPVRAGDTVKAGDVLAALEDRDLILDRLKWRAERDKLVEKAERPAKHDRTNLVILEFQIRQAELQLALAEEKLLACSYCRPLRWNCCFGRSSQMLGSPVERGKRPLRNCASQFLSLDHSR